MCQVQGSRGGYQSSVFLNSRLTISRFIFNQLKRTQTKLIARARAATGSDSDEASSVSRTSTNTNVRVVTATSCIDGTDLSPERFKQMGLDPMHPPEPPPFAPDVEDERNNIIVFNCGPLVELRDGECDLPGRVTCYCRHHKEKSGFRFVCSVAYLLASKTDWRILQHRPEPSRRRRQLAGDWHDVPRHDHRRPQDVWSGSSRSFRRELDCVTVGACKTHQKDPRGLRVYRGQSGVFKSQQAIRPQGRV